jgi:zinc transport system substrate-binding protein
MNANDLQNSGRSVLRCAAALLALAGLAAIQAGCGSAPAERDDGKLRVLTSFLPLYSFTVNVAGELAEVENLLPSGVGPHDYQFAPRDLRKLSQADLLIVNGLGIEDWLAKAIRSVRGRNAPQVIEVAQGLESHLIHGITPLQLEGQDDRADSHRGHKHRHEHKQAQGPNPHIWLDPLLAQEVVRTILGALQAADPANADGYAANAQAYLERLEALHHEIERGLRPLKDEAVITYHDAFPYFARRYELKIVGVVEKVPDVTPSARYLEALLRAVRENNVKVIFTEPQFSPRLARQIARDVDVRIAQLDTLETGPLTPEAYEEGMRRNLLVLQEQLQEP